MIPLTKEEKKIHRGQRKCHICKKEFSTDDSKKKSFKVKDHCHYTGKYRGAAHKICNLIYKIPKEIPVVFHNGSTYDYHFMIKELAEKFKGQFECLGENTEKYIAFSVPIKKEITKKDKNGNDIIHNKVIDSFRFMSISLSSLVDSLSDEVYDDNCPDCRCNLDYIIIKDDQLILRCFECKKNHNKDFGNELTKRFADIYEFYNEDINKFMLF